MPEPVLELRGLTVEFETDDGVVHAVTDVSWSLRPGEVLGLVGESGSGKTVSLLSVLGLIPTPPGRIVSGQALFRGEDLLALPPRRLREIRGGAIGVIFQDPTTALNPVLTIGDQIAEAITIHDPQAGSRSARGRTIELLDLVGIPNAARAVERFPHELSGGMRQRAVIAMAIANRPSVLVADEPTTALDVTVQAQIIEVLEAAQRETQAATVLITHDLGLIAELADQVVVMYAGKVVETADVHALFGAPRHPYTAGLLSSVARLEGDVDRLEPIPGQPPSLITLPPGCAFHPRCTLSQGRPLCRESVPELRRLPGDRRSACHFAEELAAPRPRAEAVS